MVRIDSRFNITSRRPVHRQNTRDSRRTGKRRDKHSTLPHRVIVNQPPREPEPPPLPPRA